MADYSSFDAGTAHLTVEPELAVDFRAQLEAKLAAVDHDFKIAPDLDMSDFATKVNAYLGAHNFETKIRINPDFDEFTQRVNSMAMARDLHADVRINPDFGSDFQARLNAIAALRDYYVPVRVELRDLATAEAKLEILTRDRTVDVDINITGGGAAASASRSLSLISGLKFAGVTAGIFALTGAVVGLVGAAGGALSALAGIGGVAAVGASGMFGAFSAKKNASESAGSDAAATESAQIAATEGLANAQYSLAEAQRGVTEAQRNAETAQQRLNSAYTTASRELRDMNSQLKDAELSQEGAAIAVARARMNLAQVNSNPRASAIDRQDADLQLRQAQSRYDQAKTKTADQRVDTAVANAKGVEGSDTVQNAKDNVDKAQQGVATAEHDVVLAHQAVAAAERQLAEAGASAGAGQDKLAEALAKLSPAARDFYDHVVALGPAWHELQQSVQENMFAGLGESFTSLAENQMPAMKSGMEQLATGINVNLKQTFAGLDATLTNLTNNGSMQQWIDGTNAAMSGMSPMVSGLTNMMVEMGAQVGPALGLFLSEFGNLMTQIGPALGSIGADLLDALTPVLPVLGDLIKAMAEHLGPILPTIGDLIANLARGLIAMMPGISAFADALGGELGDILPQLGASLGKLFEDLTPLMPSLGELAQSLIVIFDAVEPLLPPVVELVAAIGTQFAGALADVAVPLGQLATGLSIMLGWLEPLYPIIGDIIIGYGLWVAAQWALDAAMAANPIGIIIGLVTALVAAIVYIATQTTFFQDTWDAAWELMLDIGNWIKDTFAGIWHWLYDEHIKPVWDAIVGAIEGAWNDYISPVWNSLTGGIKELGGFFSDLGSDVKGVWQDIVNTIASAVSAIGGFLKKIPDVGFGTGTMRSAGESMVAWADSVKRAGGGPIIGPGGPTDDVIPAMLSNGEYVVNAAAVAKYGPLISAINEDALPKFASGGPVNALQFAQDHPSFPYVWGGTTAQGADCSGWVGDLQQVAMGVANPTARLGTTYNVLDGTWPGFIPGASPGDAFVVGANEGHMVASILGTNVESRGGVGALMGAAASSPFDPQFTTRGHIDPAVFQPAYVADGGEAFTDWGAGPNWGGTPQSRLNSRTDGIAGQAIGDGTGNPLSAEEADPTSWSGLAGKAAASAAKDAVKEQLGDGDTPTLPDGFATGFTDLFPEGLPQFGLTYKKAGGLLDTAAAPVAGEGLDALTDAIANQPIGAGTANGTGNDDPKTWSDVANIAAREAATGYVSDALGVFGMPDELPPLVKAGQMLQANAKAATAAEQAAEQAADAQRARAAEEASRPVPSTTNPSAGATPFQENPFAHEYIPGAGAQQWRGVIEAVLDLGGWSRADTDRTVDQVDIESGGDPNAVNNWDINAANGDPSKGLLQVIGGTYQAFKSANLLDSQTDPANNLFAGINYAIDRYGSLANIWPTRAGYATGGSVWGPGTTTSDSIPAWLSDREFVVNAKSADANRPVLEAMNRDAHALDGLFTPQSTFAQPRSSRSTTYGGANVDNSMQVHISTPDLDGAFQRAKSWETARGLSYTGRWR